MCPQREAYRRDDNKDDPARDGVSGDELDARPPSRGPLRTLFCADERRDKTEWREAERHRNKREASGDGVAYTNPTASPLRK